MKSSEKICYIEIPVTFPEGVCPGQGGDGNILSIERDGEGKPVLRGTSIAGVIRGEYSRYYAEEISNVEKWFGSDKTMSENLIPSKIIFHDCRLDVDASEVTVHNIMNRHTGSVYDKGLFAIEALPPGSSGKLKIYIKSTDEGFDTLMDFINDIIELINSGVFIGGNSNRGIGRMISESEGIGYRVFDLTDLDDHADWLDTLIAIRNNDKVMDLKELKPEICKDSARLVLDVQFTIPDGEDIMIAKGNDMVPREITSADGKRNWIIPGSSLRGIFRKWMTRLAARDGMDIADSLVQFRDNKNIKPDKIAWAFIDDTETRKELARHPESVKCPILDLFGSMYAKGRIHFSSMLAEVSENEKNDLQKRTHVAIDRISGGANEGHLFENCVLINSKLVFQTRIQIRDPEEHEVKWLTDTLKALNSGVLRIGSSKASGRVIIKSIKNMNGNYSNIINSIKEGADNE